MMSVWGDMIVVRGLRTIQSTVIRQSEGRSRGWPVGAHLCALVTLVNEPRDVKSGSGWQLCGGQQRYERVTILGPGWQLCSGQQLEVTTERATARTKCSQVGHAKDSRLGYTRLQSGLEGPSGISKSAFLNFLWPSRLPCVLSVLCHQVIQVNESFPRIQGTSVRRLPLRS